MPAIISMANINSISFRYNTPGNETWYIDIPANIPENTALTITLYTAFQYHTSSQWQQEDRDVVVSGAARHRITSVIWSIFDTNVNLNFQSGSFSDNVDIRRVDVGYAGYDDEAAHKIAQDVFGKDADVVLSAYRAPGRVNIPSHLIGRYNEIAPTQGLIQNCIVKP